jgi:hypothetical protein
MNMASSAWVLTNKSPRHQIFADGSILGPLTEVRSGETIGTWLGDEVLPNRSGKIGA